MSDKQHAPTPWKKVMLSTCSAAWPAIVPETWEDGDNVIAELETSFLIRESHRGKAVTFEEDQKAFKRAPEHDEVEANAARIISCVNALAGVADPEGFVRNYEAVLDALRGCLDELEATTQSKRWKQEAITTAKSALARAEGKEGVS